MAAIDGLDGLDGLLLVPPDRTQILGRASWKPRYVVVGKPRSANTRPRQGSTSFAQGVISGRANSFAPRPLAKVPTSDDCLSVYKSKDDSDFIQQWPLGCVTDCQIQLVSNRKHGPVLPTLVITISDKERRRRSGRATGFISANKDSGTTTLWFRTVSDDQCPGLRDWARFILARKGANSSDGPVSPVATTPYSGRSRDNSDNGQRPGSGSRLLQHMSSTATHSNSTGLRDRPATFSSESPSLRSKRSDVSSPSSNNHAAHKLPFGIPEQHYTTVLPMTASPGEYRGEFIEGWTAAQGRSSALSSPTRGGRDSASSQGPYPAYNDATSPPAPGETILDRAFQLGHIPGAEMYIPGQEKLSSIARFDALMREAEERRKKQDAAARAEQAAMRSAFDEDDSSDDDDDDDDDDDAESDEADQRDANGSDADSDATSQVQDDFASAPLMSPGAQKALAFIAGRHESNRKSESHRPSVSRTHLSYHAGPAHATSRNQPPPSRPHTAHAKTRPGANRTQSAPRIASAANTSLDLPGSAASGSGSGKRAAKSSASASQATSGGEKRHSGSSAKGLSFTEFTKRLSSTSSSLLLVQTNVSAGSNRGSSEIEGQPPSAPRANLTSRGAISGPATAPAAGQPSPSSPQPRSGDSDRRCGWRGNVGVVGAEGGLI
ncbi:hypothetical protein HRG_003046 [Hirsutella rhossiliensis]|uniref:Uncharacterized protein n=1 Tax=Hirsutella rhossiliensis TaxID=111463 RepID=A0A9P8SKQ7_9HYPO|nr:uncharacterized protein HRG_03046 [Hirsutella rhossiliensis]KAH0965030.1 hypothetical protein HRG_03046 [Hirsutella rhossiliensis]